MKALLKFVDDHDIEACIALLSIVCVLMFIATILFVNAR